MAASNSNQPAAPTMGDMKLVMSYLKHNTTKKPEVNWQAVADENNLKNIDVAKTRFGQVKRKYAELLNDGAAATVASPIAAPTTPGSAKTTPAKTGSGVKKATGRVGTKGKKAVRAKKEEDVEDEEIPAVKIEDKSNSDFIAESRAAREEFMKNTAEARELIASLDKKAALQQQKQQEKQELSDFDDGNDMI